MTETIKVLHFSSHNENCGIGKYQEQLIAGMKDNLDIEHTFFDVSPHRTRRMSNDELAGVLKDLKRQLQGFDILHIQHELSFFTRNQLSQVIDVGNSLHKKVMVTVHTAPEVQYVEAQLQGIGPRSIIHYMRSKRASHKFLKSYVHPLNNVELVIVPNTITQQSLIKRGVLEKRIAIIRLHVPDVTLDVKSDEIATNLNRKPGDIIFCTVGFLSASKGILHAVKALTFLPPQYKLAIIGGAHPRGDNEGFYDEVCDVIRTLQLQDRVYITGYVQQDDHLNALIRECEVCVYSYDKKYYAYVSSAALNNAFANHKTVVAFPTMSLIETNAEIEAVKFCSSSNYYELARVLRTIDLKRGEQLSAEYATKFSVHNQASQFAEVYRKLVRKR